MATLGRSQPFYFGTVLNGNVPPMHGGEYSGSLTGVQASLKEYGTVYQEDTGQSWAAGDLLTITSGLMRVAPVGGTGGVQSTGPICGIALSAASGVQYTPVYFRIIRSDELYVMNVMHTTAASALANQTHLGGVFAIRRDTVSGNGTNFWGVDVENSALAGTNPEANGNSRARVQVVGFPLKNPFDSGNPAAPVFSQASPVTTSDVYGLVIVRFINLSISLDGVSQTRVLQLAG